MPAVDDRPEPEGLSNDARLARWVKAHVPNTRVRAGEQKTVMYRGEELYALLSEVAEHFYWLGTEDVQHHAAHMQEFWAAAKRRPGRDHNPQA
jgi:hypothetical protein